ncbi:MAG: hypothetical protein ACUVT6_11960 [Thermodesulfobacteriota bacterium]
MPLGLSMGKDLSGLTVASPSIRLDRPIYPKGISSLNDPNISLRSVIFILPKGDAGSLFVHNLLDIDRPSYFFLCQGSILTIKAVPHPTCYLSS